MAARRKEREAKTIPVYLRIRPPKLVRDERGGHRDEREDANCDVIHVKGDHKTVTLGENPKPYCFDYIFEPQCHQTDVFDRVKVAVDDAMSGYHGLLFVYGQTGTGKTWTISGPTDPKARTAETQGVLQRSLGLLYSKIAEDKSGDYELGIQFIQIYQEIVQDLLAPQAKGHDLKRGLPIHDDPDIEGGVQIKGVTTQQVFKSASHMTTKEGFENSMDAFHLGDSNRSVAGTNMNDSSSRSHTVFSVLINRRERLTEADYEDTTGQQKEEFKGRLILVDLAGCERQKKTGAAGARLAEGSSINTSLLVLGKVIKALTDPRQFVPYRESKLTRLLQYSLAGNGKTGIVVNVGPSELNLDETRSAIEFGQRAMTIKVSAKKHVEIDYKAAYFKLKAQLDAGIDEQHGQQLEELRAEQAVELSEKDVRIRELQARLRVLLADGRSVSPLPGSGGLNSAAASGPDSGLSSASNPRKYKERIRVQETELVKLQADKKDQDRGLRAGKEEYNELQQKVQIVRGKIDEDIAHKLLVAARLQMKMDKKDDRISRLMMCISKVRHTEYASANAQVEDMSESLTMGLEAMGSPRLETMGSRVEHADPESSLLGAADPMDDPMRLFHCVQRLQSFRKASALRMEEISLYLDKSRKAIKLLRAREEESEKYVAQLEGDLERLEAKKAQVKEALKRIKQT